MINNEFFVFLAFILIGLVIGLFFDFFRILRKVYKTSNFVTLIEDIVFWILSGTILLLGIFILNSGKIRGFLFVGIMLGLLFYITIISKFVVKFGIKLFNFINQIIIFPLKKIIIKSLFLLHKIVYNNKVFIKNNIFDFFKHKNIKKRRNN